MKRFAMSASLAILAGGMIAAGAALGEAAAPPVIDEVMIAKDAVGSFDHHALVPILFVMAVVAGMILSPATCLCPSDARLKTDIRRVGTADNGLALYHFRYLGLAQVYEGVLAQDVLAHTPDAVSVVGGYLAVDYGMLGLEMRAVN